MALCIGLGIADHVLKMRDGPVFAPPSASLVCFTPDAAALMRRLCDNTDVREVVRAALTECKTPFEIYAPLRSSAELLTVLTGIRATAGGWRFWMGQTRLAVVYADGTWGVCTRPGLFLRISEWFRRDRTDGKQTVFKAGELYYAWREGAFFYSPDRSFAVSFVDAPELKFDACESAPCLLAVELRRPVECRLCVEDMPGLPVRGRIAWSGLHPEDGGLRLAGPWPATPLVSVSAASVANLSTVLATCWSAFGSTALYDTLDRAISFIPPEDRFELPRLDLDATLEPAVAVMGVDTTQTFPVPLLAFALLDEKGGGGGQHPLEPLTGLGPTMPFEWNGRAGTITSISGEKAALCLTRSGRYWLATSQEPLMAQLAGGIRDPQPIQGDLALQLDWERFSEVARTLVERLALFELIPRMNVDDVRECLVPAMKSARGLGELRLIGRCEDGAVVLEGEISRRKK